MIIRTDLEYISLIVSILAGCITLGSALVALLKKKVGYFSLTVVSAVVTILAVMFLYYGIGSVERCYEKSLEACDQAIQRNPGESKAWYGKGVGLYNLGRYSEALAAFDQATQLDSKYAMAWFYKGETLGKLASQAKSREEVDRRDAEALVALDQSTDIDPKFAPAWRAKAIIYIRHDRYREALAASDRGAELGDKDAEETARSIRRCLAEGRCK